jgi:hypothetical protein
MPGEVEHTYLQEAFSGTLSVKRLMPYGFQYVIHHQVRGREQRALGVSGIMGEVRSLRERNQTTFDGHESMYPSIYSYRESTALLVARLKQRPSRMEE